MSYHWYCKVTQTQGWKGLSFFHAGGFWSQRLKMRHTRRDWWGRCFCAKRSKRLRKDRARTAGCVMTQEIQNWTQMRRQRCRQDDSGDSLIERASQYRQVLIRRVRLNWKKETEGKKAILQLGRPGRGNEGMRHRWGGGCYWDISIWSKMVDRLNGWLTLTSVEQLHWKWEWKVRMSSAASYITCTAL